MSFLAVSDAELVGRCRDGEERAWDELVERFSGYVFAILSRGFRMADADAEDVFQELFARLYEKLGTLQDDAAIRAWIGQTTRRLAIDRYRAAAREAPAERELADVSDLDSQLERLDQALDVRCALGAIPEHCQEVVVRFFIRDQSYRVIADELQIASGTIASRISRCLDRLRDQLEPAGAASG